MTDDVVVTNNADRNRYEAHLDGELAGFAEYVLSDEVITFVHTEVDERFGGRGIGGALARGALDDVRERAERSVVPVCPFINKWIQRHPDYKALLHNAPDGEVAP